MHDCLLPTRPAQQGDPSPAVKRLHGLQCCVPSILYNQHVQPVPVRTARRMIPCAVRTCHDVHRAFSFIHTARSTLFPGNNLLEGATHTYLKVGILGGGKKTRAVCKLLCAEFRTSMSLNGVYWYEYQLTYGVSSQDNTLDGEFKPSHQQKRL